ncbi:MAG: hypothetical protein ACLUDG_00475 [Butyricicoccus sp.]
MDGNADEETLAELAALVETAGGDRGDDAANLTGARCAYLHR